MGLDSGRDPVPESGLGSLSYPALQQREGMKKKKKILRQAKLES